MKAHSCQFPLGGERGVSLVVVMVMMLLATVVVLGSTRVGWLNEKLVGSTSDYQRTFAAAEAIMRDAENDVRGLKVDNTPCKTGTDFIGCRNFKDAPFFPANDQDLDKLATRTSVVGNVQNCVQGICLPAGVDGIAETNWTVQANLNSMIAVSARYGEYTGNLPTAAGNPVLNWDAADDREKARAWYWVEVFRYAGAKDALPASVPYPGEDKPYVYRITAYAVGLKPGSRVWLRSVFVPLPTNQEPA